MRLIRYGAVLRMLVQGVAVAWVALIAITVRVAGRVLRPQVLRVDSALRMLAPGVAVACVAPVAITVRVIGWMPVAGPATRG